MSNRRKDDPVGLRPRPRTTPRRSYEDRWETFWGNVVSGVFGFIFGFAFGLSFRLVMSRTSGWVVIGLASTFGCWGAFMAIRYGQDFWTNVKDYTRWR
jgi:hypothetical protein